uniref:Phosphoribosyltransferase domain-containing protein n=1 Tax=Phaeomonas parva TaxID=124430 RepID=A0A7S1U7E7_9STRA
MDGFEVEYDPGFGNYNGNNGNSNNGNSNSGRGQQRASVNGQPFDVESLPEGVSFTPAFVPESIEEWEVYRVDDDFDFSKEDVEYAWDMIFSSEKKTSSPAAAAAAPAASEVSPGTLDEMQDSITEVLEAVREDLLLDASDMDPEFAELEGLLFGLPEEAPVDYQKEAPALRATCGRAFDMRDREPEYPFGEAWVTAGPMAQKEMLRGNFENWGVDTLDNFEPACWRIEGVRPTADLEQVAMAKAEALARTTGLPAVAAVNCVDIEPFGSRRNAVNARFRIIDNDESAGRFIEQLALTSRPGNGHRAVMFETCIAFVDPNRGHVAVDRGFCRSDVSCASGNMFSISTDLALQMLTAQIAALLRPEWYWEPPAWRTPADLASVTGLEPGAQRLQERLLRDGRVLESNIVDVSAFMDGFVDTNLVQDCGTAIAGRFAASRPTKVLTVATTGLAAAVPVAQQLQVPMIYARKQRSVVMPDSYIAGYSSRTVGKSRELLIVKEHITASDRVLIIDDFLSSGACQDALLRILSEAGAECVGVGVLFEKVYEAGRNYLSGYGLQIESLAKIQRVDRGTIELAEEGSIDAEELDGGAAYEYDESNPPPSLVRGNIARRT